MNMADLFQACNLAGIQLSRHGEDLQLRSDKGKVPDDIKAAAHSLKGDLLRLLPDVGSSVSDEPKKQENVAAGQAEQKNGYLSEARLQRILADLDEAVAEACEEEARRLKEHSPRPLGKNPLYALLPDGTTVEIASVDFIPEDAKYWCRQSDPFWTPVLRQKHPQGCPLCQKPWDE